MAPKTYTNEHGEKMHMKFRQILTIDHDDIGMVYHMPDGRFYYLCEEGYDTQIAHPETGDTIFLPQYKTVMLSQEEINMILEHIEG
jgi:hypothetical protein